VKPKDKRDRHLLENFANPDPLEELSDKDVRKLKAVWKKVRHKRTRRQDKDDLRRWK